MSSQPVSQQSVPGFAGIPTNGKFLVGLFLIKNCNVIWLVTESFNNSRPERFRLKFYPQKLDSNCFPTLAKFPRRITVLGP